MPGRKNQVDLLAFIQLDRSAHAPSLISQLYEGVTQAIRHGELRAGDRLPSSRELAEQLGVSRIVVTEVYQRLSSEKKLRSEHGRGSFIAASETPGIVRATRKASASRLPLAGCNFELLSSCGRQAEQSAQPFALTAFNWDNLPEKDYIEIATRFSRAPWFHAGFCSPAGYEPLRKQLAAFWSRAFDVDIDSRRIVITNGIQQSLNLSAQVLFKPGDSVLVENPGYPLHRLALKCHGLDLQAADVDESGLNFLNSGKVADNARGVLVTASHHFPLGMTLGVDRRNDLIEWARSGDRFILEDGYDWLLSFQDKQWAPMAFDERAKNNTVFLGSFSRTIYPKKKIGFMIVPHYLEEYFIGAKMLADRHSSEIHQFILANFLESGAYERHLKRLRNLYQGNRLVLRKEILRHIGNLGRIVDSDNGIHLAIVFNVPFDDVGFCKLLNREAGIESYPLSVCYLENPRYGLILGYGGMNEKQVKYYADQLFECLKRFTVA